MKKVLVIVGPTASGKSALAVKLARKFKGEIISADSRQVYKGLNIGTGKITKKEMDGVPHYLLDVANPKKQFNVSEYKKLSLDSLHRIKRRNKLAIIVGGTGFYIDALTGLANFPNVPPNKKLRAKLNKKTNKELFKILKKKDSKRAQTIDLNNKVRLVRALEIIEKLGKVPKKKLDSSKDFIYVGLKPDNLDRKIYKRIKEWLKKGLVKEVNKLHKNGISWKRLNEIGLIYHSVSKYLQGKITKEKMIQEIYVEIRQYAKRQMTWFKHNKQIRWFKPNEYRKIEKYARIALK